MTSPPDAGPDPEPPGERRGLESYPEFFAYPIDPDLHETAVIPRFRTGSAPPYQTPYSPPPADRPGRAAIANSVADEGNQPPAPLYPETYIKDKASAHPPQVPESRTPEQAAPRSASPEPRQPWPSQQQAAPQQASPSVPHSPRASQPGSPQPMPQQAPPSMPHSPHLSQAPQPHESLPHAPAPQAQRSSQLQQSWPSQQQPQQAPPSRPHSPQAPQSASPQPHAPTPQAQRSPELQQSWPSQQQQPTPPQTPPSSASSQPQWSQALPLPQPASPSQPDSQAPARQRQPAQPRSRAARKPGRRRAKRSLAATLWPFQAFSRPASPSSTHIRSRSTTATVWRKLRADRAAVLGAYTIVVLILLAVFAPLVTGAFGVDPTTLHPQLTDATFGPHGGFGGISWAHPLGVDQRMGRDILARLLFGARVSLLIAGGATVLSVGIGVALGVVSGYLGGRVDLVIMRVADVFLAFPLMLFALGLTGALSDQAFGLSGNALRIAIMIFVMGFFNWPYIARIVRGEVLSLRGREFVDAARAMGASTRWIIWRELLPNLLAPILVYTTLLIPANIVFEAGLSALGIGLDPPASSWGQMMTDAVATVYTDPEYLIVPGMAVFITVLAFNLFGDGLRNATDPTAQ